MTGFPSSERMRSENIFTRNSVLAAVFVVIQFSVACTKPKIEAYSIPTEHRPPPGWVQLNARGPEKERYGIDEGKPVYGTTVTVTVLEGLGGGIGANFNRWRGQLGLPRLEGADLNATLLAVPNLGEEVRMVDINGTSVRTSRPSRLVGVIMSLNELTWFYKLSGPPESVEEHKEEFLEFLNNWR